MVEFGPGAVPDPVAFCCDSASCHGESDVAGDIVVVGDGRAVYSAAVQAGQDDCRAILPRQVARVLLTLYFIYFAATAGEAVGVPGLAGKMFT